MNLRFILNTLIIVLIVHFVLENINLKIDIGRMEPEASSDDSVKFLTENLENFDPRQDLLDYINNKSNDVRGKDFYKTDYNTPHFNSNLTDVHSFYNINYDTNDCTHYGFDGINFHQLMKKKQAERDTEVPSSSTTEKYENSSKVQQNVAPPYQPEQWHYKDEFPMNGGQQEGVVGYTKIEDDFAPYPNQDTFLKPNQYQQCTGQTTDLRYDRQNYHD